MNSILILSILLFSALLFFFLYYKKWKVRHIFSLLFALIFMTLFSIFGKDMLVFIWHNANASTLWVIMFFIVYLGGGIFGSIPLLIDGTNKKELKKIFKILIILLSTGLIYTAIDNLAFGPFAVGTNSPYIGQDLCHINPTYYAEDVFFGCVIQTFGMNPFTQFASLIVYYLFSAILLIIAILLWGAKKAEKLIFE